MSEYDVMLWNKRTIMSYKLIKLNIVAGRTASHKHIHHIKV